MKRPKAILFDHDGVLVASEALHRAAWRLLGDELGLPFKESDILHLVGKTAPETIAFLLTLYRPNWKNENYDVDELSLRKNAHYLKLTQSQLQLYPQVRELLEWCKDQNILTAVVSNAKKRELMSALDQLGLSAYFKQIISRDDAKAFKPDPTPYLLGATLLGIDVKNCLAVEDSPPGLEAAIRAEIPAAAVKTNFKENELSTPVLGRPDLKPIWMGESIEQLFAWLRGLPI